jgi:hypothetical protein
VFSGAASSATEAETPIGAASWDTKRPPLGRAASDPPESARSADVRDPFLRPRLSGVSRLSGKLKHCGCLTFRQVRQKLNALMISPTTEQPHFEQAISPEKAKSCVI